GQVEAGADVGALVLVDAVDDPGRGGVAVVQHLELLGERGAAVEDAALERLVLLGRLEGGQPAADLGPHVVDGECLHRAGRGLLAGPAAGRRAGGDGGLGRGRRGREGEGERRQGPAVTGFHGRAPFGFACVPERVSVAVLVSYGGGARARRVARPG